MVDVLTSEQRRLNMSRIRARHTKPEIFVRRLLHRSGFRFRLHRSDLPGKPDIVLAKHNTVIFVNGCFWHGHNCSLFRLPASRPEFWQAKIDANRARDQACREQLNDLGWRHLRVWECALKGPNRLPVHQIEDELFLFLRGGEMHGQIKGLQAGKCAEAIQ